MRVVKKSAIFLGILLTSSTVLADTLSDAVQHGMITNPDILFNTAKGLSARQDMDRAKGAYFPSIDAAAGFGREESNNPTTRAIQGAGKRTLDRTESSIEFRQNLFAGGGIANELKRTDYLYQAQKWKTQGVSEDLALEIVDKYLNILLQERLYAYTLDNLKAHRSVFGMIKDRSEAGLSRTAEQDQADARLALALSNKIAAEADLREARITYAKVVGKWPSHLSWPRVPSNKELPRSVTKAIQRGLDNHPTIKSSYADIKEAKAQYEVARAAYYPKVDLVLSASSNRNLDGLIGENDDKLAMVRMNYNLFRGGADEARVRETAYRVQEAFEVKNKALIDLKESVRLSWNTWIYSGLRIKPLKTHVNASSKTRGAYQEQFKVGKRTLLDLLDSQNEYYQSQIEYVRAQNTEAFARYRLLNGMGVLLCYLKMKLPENVVNNDVFTSAETHVLLHDDMDDIPYPDTTDRTLVLAHPVANMNKVKLTPAIVHKNATPPLQVAPKDWYVNAGTFSGKASHAAAVVRAKRLTKLGYKTCICKVNGCDAVLIGPYEYKGHAANTMEKLKEVANVPGILVTFKRTVKHCC